MKNFSRRLINTLVIADIVFGIVNMLGNTFYQKHERRHMWKEIESLRLEKEQVNEELKEIKQNFFYQLG